MKTMKERLLINRVKDLIDRDVSNGWPDELSFYQIIKLYSLGKDEKEIRVFTEGLEEATLNRDIEVKKIASHRFCLIPNTVWQRYELIASVIEEVERVYKLNENLKISGLNLPFGGQLLLNSAEVRLNQEPIKTNHPTNSLGTPIENVIILDWYYKPKALSLWFKNFGCEPGDFLNTWFKGELLQENADKKMVATNSHDVPKFNINNCLPGFPKSRPGAKASAILAACEDFFEAHSFCPSPKQIMNQIVKKPPKGFMVEGLINSAGGYASAQNVSSTKLDAIKIEDEVIKVPSFLRLCRSYLSPKTEDSGE